MSKINPQKYNCDSCLYRCSSKKDFNKHLLTNKHQTNIGKGINPRVISRVKYTCVVCDYVCSSNKDYNKHILTQKHITKTEFSVNLITIPPKSPPKIPAKNPPNGYMCKLCNFSCKYKREYNIHISTKKHARIAANHPSISDDDSSENVKQMVIACMQNQDFLQTMITTISGNHIESQKSQQEFQNKFLEVLPTLGSTTIQNQSNTFNLTTYLTIDCKDAETFDETKQRLKEYILGLDTIAFIEHAANSSSNAIMEKVIRGFYSSVEPCKRSIQTVDVARGKSYVKHDEENGFILDEEGNAVSKVACAAGHHSINHCLKYKKDMKNADKTWKPGSIGAEYDNVDNKINNMWRFTDANTTMAKKMIGTATKIDKAGKIQ